MKLLEFIPIKLALVLILGILCGPFLPWPTPLFHVVLVLGLAVMAYLHFFKNGTRATFGYATAFTVFVMGAMAQQGTQPKHQTDHYRHFMGNGKQTVHLKIKQVLKPTESANRYIAQVLHIGDKKTSGNIVLRSPKDTTTAPFAVDNELLTLATIDSISGPLNPHQFNYRQFMARQGIHFQMRAAGHEVVVLSGTATLWGLAANIRDRITQKLAAAGFKDDELAVVQALFLGDRTGISTATYDAYKDAGAVHILALSGLHIGILLYLINFLLGPLRMFPWGQTVKLVLSVMLLWAFAFLAGLSPSIIRACTMFSFVAYALYLNRPRNNFNILALSVLFILLFIDPNLIFQVGFQMSYAAVVAIVGLYPLFQRLWFPKNRVLRYVWQLFTVSIAAQLGVLPISLFYFHQFPALFFVSNLILIPFMGILLALGILVIGLALANLLPDLLANLFKGCIQGMNKVVSWVSAQEGFVFTSISFDAVQVVLFYGVVLSLGYLMAKASAKRLQLLLITVVGLQLWTYGQNLAAERKKTLIIRHGYGGTVLLERNGRKLTVLGQGDGAQQLINALAIGERIDTIAYGPLKNNYTYGPTSLLIIDSTGTYVPNTPVDVVLLSASPQLHLDRLIRELHPKLVIADGSNYPSAVLRWQESCTKENIAFYHTGTDGALIWKASEQLVDMAHQPFDQR
jgi:competence protein ComEC